MIRKMRLLFVGITNHHHIQNFAKSIKKNLGYELYAINTNPLYINNEGEQGLFEKHLEVPRYNSHLKDFISKIFSPIKIMSSFKEKIDVVQFHLVSLYTLPLAIIARIKKMKVSCFVWGSEFLRANKLMKLYFNMVFKISHSVVCDSTALCEKLQATYPQIADRISFVQFGSAVIDNLLEASRIEKCSKGKTVVMCGYNGSRDQKQIEIIEALEPLRNQLYLIFPMTYACGDEYRKEVREKAEKDGFEFDLLDHFIEGEEWEEKLIDTDIFIHMQSTDSFSSSVAEHLLLGNIVVNGEWLEYEDLDKENVFYLKSNFNTLCEIVDDCIKNKNKYNDLCVVNKDKIVKMKSLNYCVNHYWKNYFEDLLS